MSFFNTCITFEIHLTCVLLNKHIFRTLILFVGVTVMEDDEELEKAMQSISPAKELQSCKCIFA